jgi:hypothetical protein
MNDRIKRSTTFTFKRIPLSGMWLSGRGFGASFGIKNPSSSRNVHVTVYFRDEILNCHITDTAKDPERIWEKEMHLSEFETLYHEFISKCIRRYYWHQKYLRLSDRVLNTIKSLGETGGLEEFDATPLLEGYLNEDFLVKTRLRTGFYEGQKMGFLPRRNELYFTIPFEKRKMVIINSDTRKTPFWKIPTVQGFTRYFEYLVEEEILERAVMSNPERRKQLEAAFHGMLAEVES